MNIKKYLDGSGLTHLWTRIEENYPTNEDLTNVVNAIDETKADKTDLFSGSWDDLTNKPFYEIDNFENLYTGSFQVQQIITSLNNVELEPGQYNILFNDQAYTIDYDGKGTFGDSSYINYPFCIRKMRTGQNTFQWQVSVKYAGGNPPVNTIVFSRGSYELKQIEEKFIPESILAGKKTTENGEIFNDYVNNLASAEYSHAEGQNTHANGLASHAEGCDTVASGEYSHAEGYTTGASGNYSHAEGYHTVATTAFSHTEGFQTFTYGLYAHAEGCGTRANGTSSHAEGEGTIANGVYSHVQGKYNIKDTEDKYAHIVGNGADTDARSNAHTLDWDGNAWFAGDVFVGSTEGSNKDEGSQKLATEGYVNSSIDNALAGVSSDTIVEQNKNRDIKFWVGTEEELDLIETRDENCLYFTTDSEEENSAVVNSTTVTLDVNNWTLNANNIYVQEVQVNGVLADANAQLITISPYGNGFDNHVLAAEVFCIEQKENALVFRAINDIPEGNVQLLIVLEDINWIN